MFVGTNALMRGSLMSPEPGAGGGAGGKDDPPKALTEEDVGRIVNAAVTSQLARVLPKAVGEALGGLKLEETIGKTVTDAIAKLAPIPPNPDDDKNKGKKVELPPEVQQQLKDLSAKYEASEAKAIAAEKQRIELEQARFHDAALGRIKDSISPKLNPDYQDLAIREIGTRVKIDATGKATVSVKRAPYKGAPEQDEDLALDEALPILLASKDMARFLLPPGQQQQQRQVSNRAPGTNGTPAPAGVTPTSEAAKAQSVLAELQAMGADTSFLDG